MARATQTAVPGGSQALSWAQVRESMDAAAVGLLLLRLVIGVIFLGHGLQKFGWFEGGGYPTSISQQEFFLKLLGYSSTSFLAWVVTTTELCVGAFLLLGVLTPLAAAGVIGVTFQFVAGGQWDAGLYGDAQSGGFEFSLAIMATGLCLAFTGPGAIGLDPWITRRLGVPLGGVWWGVAGVALGLVVGAIVLTAFGVGFGGTPQPVLPAP